ncbi:hypothetical protein HanPSC8_Chr01g0042221 [Helianthus annuus]|nr:hypothetical protein HanPSC8_Chr01g0042221 [Helianthus annuus]
MHKPHTQESVLPTQSPPPSRFLYDYQTRADSPAWTPAPTHTPFLAGGRIHTHPHPNQTVHNDTRQPHDHTIAPALAPPCTAADGGGGGGGLLMTTTLMINQVRSG